MKVFKGKKSSFNSLKKLFSGVMAIGILIGGFPTVYAAENTEKLNVEEDIIEFADENGEIMAIFTPYSETNPAPDESTRSTTFSVDCSLEGGNLGHLSNKYSLYDGDKIELNINISPQVLSSIGLYNNQTEQYGFPEGGSSSKGWYGTLTVSGNGLYSIAFMNHSNTTATYKGSYTFK